MFQMGGRYVAEKVCAEWRRVAEVFRTAHMRSQHSSVLMLQNRG